MDTARNTAIRLNSAPQLTICNLHFAICNRRSSRRAFTLVELLVVITIIGILAALITAAGAGALKKARQTRIKTETDQIGMGLQTFKDTYQSYPPNCQVDGTTGSDVPISEAQVLTNIKRAMKQAFPRHREPDALIAALAGLAPNGALLPAGDNLQGGMSAGEALVFWLGGFSSDPKYPISGEGGPSYAVIDASRSINIPAAERNQHDPLQRTWVFPFEVARLQPRTNDNFFDQTDRRFIEYQVTVNGQPQTRRINFWQYVPAQSEQPYLYFDTSRHAPGELTGSNSLVGTFDPPAATNLNPNALHVHAIKTASQTANTNEVRIQFANKDKFQILHAGLDEEWGEDAFEQMSVHEIRTNTPEDYLLFPDGPFTGEVADTIVNFSEGTLEASQP